MGVYNFLLILSLHVKHRPSFTLAAGRCDDGFRGKLETKIWNASMTLFSSGNESTGCSDTASVDTARVEREGGVPWAGADGRRRGFASSSMRVLYREQRVQVGSLSGVWFGCCCCTARRAPCGAIWEEVVVSAEGILGVNWRKE